jgi:hypothetical protein
VQPQAVVFPSGIAIAPIAVGCAKGLFVVTPAARRKLPSVAMAIAGIF